MLPERILIKRTKADAAVSLAGYALVVSMLIVSAACLVAYGAYGLSPYLLLSCFCAGGLSLVLFIADAVLTARPCASKQGSLKRAGAADAVFIVSLFFLLLASILLLLLRFVSPSNVEPLDGFTFYYGICSGLISLLLLLYEMWHQAWIRENPERYEELFFLEVTGKEERKPSPSPKNTAPKKIAKADGQAAGKAGGAIEGEYREKD